MNNWKFGVVTGLVLMAILIGARFLPASNNRENSSVKGDTVNEINVDKEALAKHLTQIGAKVYGTTTCHACIYQKELFGDAWQYINYVECSALDGGQTEACLAAKIDAYPTWEFKNGAKEVGVMTLTELIKKSAFTQ